MQSLLKSSTNLASTDTLLDDGSKYNGLLIDGIKAVQRQVHMTLTAQPDALEYIESLILQLLINLCSGQPHTWKDVEELVEAKLPKSIFTWAHIEAKQAIEKSKHRSKRSMNKGDDHVVFPVDKLHHLLVKDFLKYKVDIYVTVYIAAVLEHVAADILKLTGNYVKNHDSRHHEITLQDVKVAICADKVLISMFFDNEDDCFLYDHNEILNEVPNNGELKYDEIVKYLILEENRYIRDLNMVIKIFKEPFETMFPGSKDIETIFSNIVDLYELTVKILTSVEDTLEMTSEEEGCDHLVGACFEELIEGAEFDVYEKYCEDILDPQSVNTLHNLISKPETKKNLQEIEHYFYEATKYVLPKLLSNAVLHVVYYYEVIKELMKLSTDYDDLECLNSVHGILSKLKSDLDRRFASISVKRRSITLHSRRRLDGAKQKIEKLKIMVDGFEESILTKQHCTEFIIEGSLAKFTNNRKPTTRYVFLFDGIILLTKQQIIRRGSVSTPNADYKLKEIFNMRTVSVADRDSVEDLMHGFDVLVNNQVAFTLNAKNSAEKNQWMTSLATLLSNSSLQRMLDSKLSEEEKRYELKIPTPDIYKFGEDDSDKNIIFETANRIKMNSNINDIPLIRGATLLKLVERLTYHQYADTTFVRTFLTTYRTFTTPHKLMDLLIERFDIADPVSPPVDQMDFEADAKYRIDMKKFRKDYLRPVQLHVLNVMRHWADQHWYDFAPPNASISPSSALNASTSTLTPQGDPMTSSTSSTLSLDGFTLIEKLENFLASVKYKKMRKWVESINRAIAKKREECDTHNLTHKIITYEHQPPPIEWHNTCASSQFSLMNLHPVEIARQVTLLEFDLYRAVRTSELVGSVWVKKAKSVTSPNLLNMIDFSTRFTFWLEKCILDEENFEERVLVVCRIIEVMVIFQELNNFNGVLEVVSALNSAPVHRLKHTFDEIDQKYTKLMKCVMEANELNSDHYKRYTEKLRSINPPCIPFMGMYLSNILKTEEGNPDFIPNKSGDIINFSKRRKVAEITLEIQQFQNQPYCLHVQPEIRSFFEDLDPLNGKSTSAFNDELFESCLKVEPRNSKFPAKFARRFTKDSLKSPGIKHTTRHSVNRSGAPTSLFSGSSPYVSRKRDPDSSSNPTTPHTPSSPSLRSPESSVFETVQIGDHSQLHAPPMFTTLSGSTSNCSVDGFSNILSPFSSTPPSPNIYSAGHYSSRNMKPPALPPRCRRDTGSGRELTSGENSPSHVFQSGSSAPAPHTEIYTFTQAPPLPPRAAPPTGRTIRSASTDGLVTTPQLPPKTYKGSLSRDRF